MDILGVPDELVAASFFISGILQEIFAGCGWSTSLWIHCLLFSQLSWSTGLTLDTPQTPNVSPVMFLEVASNDRTLVPDTYREELEASQSQRPNPLQPSISDEDCAVIPSTFEDPFSQLLEAPASDKDFPELSGDLFDNVSVESSVNINGGPPPEEPDLTMSPKPCTDGLDESPKQDDGPLCLEHCLGSVAKSPDDDGDFNDATLLKESTFATVGSSQNSIDSNPLYISFPPSYVQTESTYPSLPMFHSHSSSGCSSGENQSEEKEMSIEPSSPSFSDVSEHDNPPAKYLPYQYHSSGTACASGSEEPAGTLNETISLRAFQSLSDRLREENQNLLLQDPLCTDFRDLTVVASLPERNLKLPGADSRSVEKEQPACREDLSNQINTTTCGSKSKFVGDSEVDLEKDGVAEDEAVLILEKSPARVDKLSTFHRLPNAKSKQSFLSLKEIHESRVRDLRSKRTNDQLTSCKLVGGTIPKKRSPIFVNEDTPVWNHAEINYKITTPASKLRPVKGPVLVAASAQPQSSGGLFHRIDPELTKLICSTGKRKRRTVARVHNVASVPLRKKGSIFLKS